MLDLKKMFSKNFGIKLLGVTLCMSVVIPTFASIAVAPTRLEVNANKIKQNYFTTAIDIKGDADKPVRYKAYSGYFKVNEKSEIQMIEDSSDEFDISKKIRFVPSEFTVFPGRTQKLRVNISGIKTLKDGENRAILYIEDVNPKELNVETRQAGIGAQLIVKTRIGVPIYIDKGQFNKIAVVDYFKVNKDNQNLYTEMKVLSQGNSKVRYTAKIQIVKDEKLVDEYELIGRVVAGDNYYVDKTKIKLDKIKDSGEYTLRLTLSYMDEKDRRQYIQKEAKLNIVGNDI